jgi:pyruvate,water dikinase
VSLPEHVFELEPAELRAILVDGAGPSIDEVRDRWAFRGAVIASNPPTTLGPADSPPPPLAAFPKPLRRATAAMLAMIDAMEGVASDTPLTGVGVGTATYRGCARVVTDVTEAFDRVMDGDVVVASYTGPSWNSLLPLVGALVVEEGGPMCHAAIVSREFGIPAIIGAHGATTLIPDGAEVEVDPIAGTVKVLSR